MSNTHPNQRPSVTIELTVDELNGAVAMLWDVINNRYQDR